MRKYLGVQFEGGTDSDLDELSLSSMGVETAAGC